MKGSATFLLDGAVLLIFPKVTAYSLFASPLLQQQLSEECTYRNELQMQLDSKESDIEQLREKLNDLQLRMDNSSVISLQTDETDSNIAGKVTAGSTNNRWLCQCTG